ncbi:MAG: hypothetical protein KDJ17_12580 [Hyphomicrobiaceae bacterium]|nr:hypothetical protein [Hyphomicrobiaceae bacterium]
MRSLAFEKSASEKSASVSPLARLAGQPLWVWWLLAFTFIALRQWLTAGLAMGDYLGDMDDAARLVQVRDLLAGKPWFDLWTPRMGGEPGMLWHWSRLIDAPIALMLASFELVMPADTAELATRALWPLVVLAPLLYAIARAAEALSGRSAALIALVLAAMCPLGLYQFANGRIDHHNVMIAATIIATLLIGAFPPRSKRWAAAGALCGLALAVGYEALAPVAALSVIVLAWGLIDDNTSPYARSYLDGLAGVFALCFVATIPPDRWLDLRCDAISLNMVALVVIGGVGARTALAHADRWSLMRIVGVTAVAGMAGVAAYGFLEPKCLAGPLAQLPKDIFPIWFATIGENRSIVTDALSGNFEQSVGLLIYYGLGLAAVWKLYREDRSARVLFLALAATVFVLCACWQYKYTSYASFLVTLPLALVIARMPASASLSSGTIQACAAVLASQAFLLQGSKALDAQIRPETIMSEAAVPPEACLHNSAISDLAVLPPGLIAARIDLGAYIVALTEHNVLSAPYHRIADTIIANHRIFAARDTKASARILKDRKVTYVVTCAGLDDPFVSEPQWRGTLRAALVANKAPPFLVPVPLDNPHSLFKVWKVDASALDAAASP